MESCKVNFFVKVTSVLLYLLMFLLLFFETIKFNLTMRLLIILQWLMSTAMKFFEKLCKWNLTNGSENYLTNNRNGFEQ